MCTTYSIRCADRAPWDQTRNPAGSGRRPRVHRRVSECPALCSQPARSGHSRTVRRNRNRAGRGDTGRDSPGIAPAREPQLDQLAVGLRRARRRTATWARLAGNHFLIGRSHAKVGDHLYGRFCRRGVAVGINVPGERKAIHALGFVQVRISGQNEYPRVRPAVLCAPRGREDGAFVLDSAAPRAIPIAVCPKHGKAPVESIVPHMRSFCDSRARSRALF